MGRQRRAWQNGEGAPRYFSVTIPVFVERHSWSEMTARRGNYAVPPSITDETSKSRKWLPNPARPSYVEQVLDQPPQDLLACDNPRLSSGDLVGLCFSMHVWVGDKEWGIDIRPVVLVRVGHIAGTETAAELDFVTRTCAFLHLHDVLTYCFRSRGPGRSRGIDTRIRSPPSSRNHHPVANHRLRCRLCRRALCKQRRNDQYQPSDCCCRLYLTTERTRSRPRILLKARRHLKFDPWTRIPPPSPLAQPTARPRLHLAVIHLPPVPTPICRSYID